MITSVERYASSVGLGGVSTDNVTLAWYFDENPRLLHYHVEAVKLILMVER